MTREVASSIYRPGFNTAVANRTITGHWSGECPVHFKSRIDLSRSIEAVALVQGEKVIETV